jgi:hypothetical protein
MLYVFTTCALNFVPCAKLLASSVRKHMPDARFVLTLTDARPDDFRLEDEGFDEVFYLDDFTDQLDNPLGWAFGHTIMELATAIKPFTASKLMEREDCDAVMFFDPDCVLFGPMTEMREALKSHSVVLTPHASKLHENSDWLFFEKNPLKVGGFNLGFFGFQNNETGRAVSSWWRYRLRDYCIIDPDQGMFTDQKWMDLLPNYIEDFKVMRQPVYNIARWNTFQRKITQKGRKYYADGEPVQFVHFSGFYKIGPYVQGLYDRSSEPLIEDLKPLRKLSLWYGKELDEARSHPEYMQPWKLGNYSNGETISEADRRRYKNSTDLQQRYPDPFSTNILDSYWLFCRKQERIEAEVRIRERVPTADQINRSVQAHNTLLRKLNVALENQLRNTKTELVESKARVSQADRFVAQFKKSVTSLLAQVSDDQVKEAFSGVDISDTFNPEAYLNANPDVAESGLDPLVHLVRHGLGEAREAEGLDVNLFFSQHMDVLLGLIRVMGPETVSEPDVELKDETPRRRTLDMLLKWNA